MFARATDAPSTRDAPDRSAVLRWASVGGTVVAVVGSAASALTAVGFASHAAAPASALRPALYVVSALVGIVLAGLLVLRQRFPLAVCLGASACSVLLPLDASAALIALPWVLARATTRTCLVASGATAAATAAALVRDGTREHAAQVLVTIDEQTRVLSTDPTAAAYVVVGLCLLGVSVAAGLVRRARVAAERAREEQEAQASATAVLRDRVRREDERRLVAREVHDTVAHHMAAVSLQASALEVTSSGDPEAVHAAREMRASAQRAIAELRSLVTTLRSGETVTGFPDATLDDAAPLLERMAGEVPGMTTAVAVSDGEEAAPVLVRATLRVVQEAVTNARKHAAGAPVDVRVTASPEHGVDILVTNPLDRTPPRGPGVPGTGTGLLGMRERAAAVGGTLFAGPEDGSFVVRARFPWVPRGA